MIKNFLKRKDSLYLGLVLFLVVLFFYPFLLYGKLPIPADTIVGLYHPFRDLYVNDYPNGIPYKNFIITDPVRQQYIWKELAIESLKSGYIPIWNIYEMSGKPLLANFQSGVFYPLNILLFINPFSISWSIFIMLQMVLGGIFMYFYLKSLGLSPPAVVLGTVSWIFSGFFISWLEWGNIGHTVLWLPLMLIAVKRILESTGKNKELIWFFVLLFSICSSFFAGHLQSFFYVIFFVIIYMFALWFTYGRKFSKLLPFLTVVILSITVTSVQWAPTLQFIDLSGRSNDQSYLIEGWFIPFQNLIQFVSPDFFGNPSTLNYYGVFHYGEFVGYIGIGGLLFALYALLFRRDKKTLFYLITLIFCFIFVLQNPISLLPFQLKIPFISTAQPTRLLVLISFSLSVLSALGFDHFMKKKSRIIIPVAVTTVLFITLWLASYLWIQLYPTAQDALISRNNLKLPTFIFVLISAMAFLYCKVQKKYTFILIYLILAFTALDLIRFAWKYTPFVSQEYLYPETSITKFLQNDKTIFRIATTDDRILIPNFSSAYRIQSIEGYDPLFVKNYGKLIASNERSDSSIDEPFGFNRTIRPRNINSEILDFLNVKYVLSIDEIKSQKLQKVYEEGITKIYKNNNVLPRAYFISEIIVVKDEQEAAKLIQKVSLENVAVALNKEAVGKYSSGTARIAKYTSSKVEIETVNKGVGFLILTDVYYPSFRATIDGKEAEIVPINIAFRGIKVPAGKHTVTMTASLL